MINKDELRIRDPFIFVENNKYYLIGTTSSDPWNKGSDLLLYASDDLENFEKVCKLVTDGSLSSYTNNWAPELHKYRGKYYLIVSAFCKEKGRGSFIFVSDNLDENFKMLTGDYITPETWGCLDATLFVYNNKPYLCFSNEWTTPVSYGDGGSLFIAELSEDLTELKSSPQKIISGKKSGIAIEVSHGNDKGYIAEGPWLYEDNGEIVLLWSTVGKNGYTVVKSVSKNGIFGDYTFKEIVFNKDGGHCMCFEDLRGKRRLTLHQPNQTPKERIKLFYADELP